MLGALVSLISLNLSLFLIQNGVVSPLALPVTGASATTPILLTSPNHGRVRPLHGVVSGITGEIEANGLWILTPTDPNTFALSTLTAQGLTTNSVGINAYTGGGTIQYAFPDGSILLGRRNLQLNSSVASPRIVFIPTTAIAYGFEPYVGQGQAYKSLGTPEQQTMKLIAQAATDFTTFEVFITGCAEPPSPDYGDFDATQALAWSLYNVLWDAVGDAVDVKHVSWPSQSPESGTQTQRGQQLRLIVQLQQPVVILPLQFVPVGTYIEMIVEPVNPGATDPVTITINPA
jgi:hypothetical protein